MATFSALEIDQGRSYTKPPLFKGANFGYWREKKTYANILKR